LIAAGAHHYNETPGLKFPVQLQDANMAESGPETKGEITRLLISWRNGDQGAADQLFSILYQELRILARRQLHGGKDATLGTTALVHEAYVKLLESSRVDVKDRGHFFALASRVMRQIVVDYARRKTASKRGGKEPKTELDENAGASSSTVQELIEVNEALKRLEALDPRLGKLVELRFFGGLSVEETAEILETSDRTVKRDWQKARAFLYHELRRDE
jgi:RNA polymerase sigma factor (TIGR02999 family)